MSDPQTYLHYTTGGNINGGGTYLPASYGFNLADVSSQYNADHLPAGDQALYYVGTDAGADSTFQTLITNTGTDANILGYFLKDGVGSGDAANIKAEADYIHAHAAGKSVFITASNSGSQDSPTYTATPGNTDADYVSANVWPYQVESGVNTYDSAAIPAAATELESVGWNSGQVIPEYQSLGAISDYATPTSAIEGTIIAQWGSVYGGTIAPLFDYAQGFGVTSGDTAISNDTTLQAVFSAHNTITAPLTSLHYAPNGNFANGGYAAAGDPGAIGFNVADVYDSVSLADGLPSGDQGLIFMPLTGDTGSGQDFENVVNAAASDSKVYGFYLGDDSGTGDEANLKSEVDYIHAHASDKMTFIVANNTGSDTSPSCPISPSSVDMTTSKDLIGVDPYPVQSGFTTGMDLSIINDRVSAWETAGWSDSQMVPIFQAFGNYGNGDWVMPTQSQTVAMLNRWHDLLPSPPLTMAYSWGEQTAGSPTPHADTALVDSSALQGIYQHLNS